MIRAELDSEMAAMWERIQSRKAESPTRPQPLQITHTVTHLTTTEPVRPAEIVDANNFAGDPVPNPDAQGL